MHGNAPAGTPAHSNSVEDGPQLYSSKEAIRRLSISERSFRDLTKSGALPIVPIGRKVYVDRRDLEAFIASRRSTQDGAA